MKVRWTQCLRNERTIKSPFEERSFKPRSMWRSSRLLLRRSAAFQVSSSWINTVPGFSLLVKGFLLLLLRLWMSIWTAFLREENRNKWGFSRFSSFRLRPKFLICLGPLSFRHFINIENKVHYIVSCCCGVRKIEKKRALFACSIGKVFGVCTYQSWAVQFL